MKDLQLKNCRLDGRYDVRERLGRGSYAEIYLAEDVLASPESPHKTVVIKALNVFMQNDLDLDLERTLVENFQNEAIALDRVRHPNIISRLGHGTAQDLRGTVFHYLVLEYLPGGDLARFCQKKNLTLLPALDYLEQVSAGLGKAHQHDVIHRDIKPQNLLLTEDHKIVKIADFGVARVTVSDNPITRVGTNIYAPPEHSPMLAGETQSLAFSELTPAADIYSLAKTAYALITGESPRFFANQPITELPHSMRRKNWAGELVKTLNKATQNDSRRRHQTVNEFWKDLSELGKMADSPDGRITTRITTELSAIPKAHIAKGFSPNTPLKPKFNTSSEMKINPDLLKTPKQPLIVNVKKPNSYARSIQENPVQNIPATLEPVAPEFDQTEKPRRSFLRNAATFIIILGLFAGSLFATYNYLIGRGFPSLGGFSTKQKMGTAITDINLRPEPTAKNDPIGLITVNSRVKILQKDDNWYEVVITEYGNPKTDSAYANRGWAYGKYIKIDE